MNFPRNSAMYKVIHAKWYQIAAFFIWTATLISIVTFMCAIDTVIEFIKKLFSAPVFSLKSGGEIILRITPRYRIKTKVIGFYIYGMHCEKIGVVPFNAGRFYGAGYQGGERTITIKKDWHYRPAVICEWIRLKLPEKAGRWLFNI